MKRRWQIALPVVNLAIFALITWASFAPRWEHKQPSRYVWWASVALDRDPLNEHNLDHCAGADCVGWSPESIDVRPSPLVRTYLLLGLPAYIATMLLVYALGLLGVSHLWTFLLLAPVLTSAWYSLIGYLIDRRRSH